MEPKEKLKIYKAIANATTNQANLILECLTREMHHIINVNNNSTLAVHST